MLMYLKDSKKLLNLLLQTLIFRWFCVDWDFWLFSLYYQYEQLKSIHYSTSFCRKKYSQFDSRKEMEAVREDREWMFVCYILDIYYSLHSIIHSIAWTHSIAHTSNDKAKFSIKLKFLHPTHLLFSTNELR